MRQAQLAALFGAALLAGSAVFPVRAQTDDVFAFIPPGGRTLIAQAVAEGLPADELAAILAARRTREEWIAYLTDRQGSVPALQDLGEIEIATLADYLAFHMPTTAVAAQSDAGTLERTLPPDGRDYTLDYCQSCHIITVVVTQDRTPEAWHGSLNKPSHIEIKLSKEQREEMVNYLVLNAGIPIDLVPEELRAGGASY